LVGPPETRNVVTITIVTSGILPRRQHVDSRPAGRASCGSSSRPESTPTSAAGQPNRLEAKRLGVTEKTVKAHLTQIYAAIGVTDRVQATPFE
jgi:Bacterial regulatory proteins, luxR family